MNCWLKYVIISADGDTVTVVLVLATMIRCECMHLQHVSHMFVSLNSSSQAPAQHVQHMMVSCDYIEVLQDIRSYVPSV